MPIYEPPAPDANYTYIGIFSLYNRGGYESQTPIWQCDRCAALVSQEGTAMEIHLKWHLGVQ